METNSVQTFTSIAKQKLSRDAKLFEITTAIHRCIKGLINTLDKFI